jgi:tetratricopeptide (TPR) repeat protein
MKTFQKILTLFALLVIVGSCSKYLDVEPQQSLDDKVALNSDANVKSVLVGAYNILRSSAIYGGCILRNSELFGADDEIFWKGTYNGPREIFNHAIIAENGDVRDQWLNSYECINVCNNVISAIAVVNEEDQASVEGEALFLRSLMYFDLVRFYAKSYEPGQTNSQLGVPIVLEPTTSANITIGVARNTVEEVYARVIQDLNSSISLLPEKDPDNQTVYATQGAAYALLARVYLQKGDYANAAIAADAVISSGLFELTPTYAQAFNNETFSTEDIFATKFTAQDGINQMTEFWSTSLYGGRSGDIYIEDAHLDLYDPADERLALFWYGSKRMRSGKWNTQYGLVNLFRLAEMYLIRAECNEREGTSVGADPLDDYNMVHTRAGLTAATAVVLDDILYERRLELAHEGFKFHDMKRLKLDISGIPIDDNSLVFPIPSREMEANTLLVQNAGY